LKKKARIIHPQRRTAELPGNQLDERFHSFESGVPKGAPRLVLLYPGRRLDSGRGWQTWNFGGK
jgi:hypothetical protein